MSAARPLSSTYRLQLNHAFTLRHALAVVPYLHRLGVSHVYSSPILRARAGSMHGYDVVDPLALDPELGTERDLRALASALHERGMGLVLDIVPNHMSTGSENPYWDDVLTHGQASRYAHWFDIDWRPPRRALHGRVLVPVLGESLGAALERGEITLAAHDGGRLRAHYFEHSVPLDPATIPPALARAAAEDAHALARASAGREGRRRLRTLLHAQHYLLANWRRASRDLNYRRFFNIDELVALRMEDPAVFDATHRRILEWVADGTLDGLRVDHIDGLLDPRAYLERLRAAVSAARPARGGRPFPILVEKILCGDERLRADWPVQGTTGYEFLNELESVFVHASGRRSIETRYRAMLRISRAIQFEDVAYRGKLLVLRASFAPDVERVSRLLLPIARRDPRAREEPARVLTEAIVQLIACFPVYRTYIDGRAHGASPEDRRAIERALARARGHSAVPAPVLDCLADVLLAPPRPPPAHESATPDARERLAFIQRFQQACGPAAAKGVEDTALYRYIPLASLNEVGGEPDRPLAAATARLHAANAERRARWPATLLCTSTHDTKRSADVRARLDVLSELPGLWMEHTARWHALHREFRTRVAGHWAPDANAEYLLYQTLIGIWPLDADGRARPDAGVLESLRGRVDAYMRKAARESKAQTEWTRPNTPYENALTTFIRKILEPDSPSPFLDELGAQAAALARAGTVNALSRALVHLTAPGTPDLYQGDELWSFALVDPDNRRPVDFAARERLLAELDGRCRAGGAEREALLRAIGAAPGDGRLKLHVIHRALAARRARPALFLDGDYLPVSAEGEAAEHVFAFVRRAGDAALLTVVPRLTLALGRSDNLPVGEDAWGDTVLPLPAAVGGVRWECALTGRTIECPRTPEPPPLRLASVLHTFPVGLLVGERQP